jgi:polyisoprenoid-binding protein YceI
MRLSKYLALFSFLVASTHAYATTYTIDGSHTQVGFKIKHLAISNVAGSFTDVKGSFTYDPSNPKASKAEATIAVASINTQQTKRDDHLRSPDFFNAAQFPEMRFVSREVTDVQGDSFKVAGDLTIHGVTKPVVLDVTYSGAAKDPGGNERAGFSATTKINRKDFGLNWNKLLETGALIVGDEVTINLEVEGIKQNA